MVQYVLHLIGFQLVSRVRLVEADAHTGIRIKKLPARAASLFLFIAKSAKQRFQLLPTKVLGAAPKALQKLLVLAHQAGKRIDSMFIVCYTQRRNATKNSRK